MCIREPLIGWLLRVPLEPRQGFDPDNELTFDVHDGLEHHRQHLRMVEDGLDPVTPVP